MKVAVVGCGYVGLVSAVGLASKGHDITGIEVHPPRRARIASGKAPFHEPGLDELLSTALRAGTFRVTGDLGAAATADVVLLAVQTPPAADGSNDLSFIEGAAEALAGHFAGVPRPRVVATRSTVVPGTADDVLAPVFRRAGLEVAAASNPEFLREGSAVEDYLQPDRIVIGCHEEWGLDRLEELYAPFDAPVLRTTPAGAELAKYTSNAFLAMLISFSNEIARICETLEGVDVEDVLGSLHLDRRIVAPERRDEPPPQLITYLKAGVGYGGSCLPKDLSALLHAAATRGQELPLLRAVRQVNDEQASRVLDLAEDAVGPLGGKTLTVLGAAFKGGTDDIRESPGLRVIDEALARGAAVVVYDPLVGEQALSPYVETGVRVAGSLGEALAATQACIVASNALEFAALPDELGGDGVAVIDGRRILEPHRFAPERFRAVGRAVRNGSAQ